MGQIGYFFNLIIAYPIFNALMLLDHLFGDFGLSIIILTIVIRLCLFPLTLKQLRSTKATQAIQPLMADIRKKYANDQQAQYRAMQELYKEYNVNPLAGCLPLFIQLPVLYGLYGALDIVLRPTNGHLTLAAINNVIYPFLPKFATIPNSNLSWFSFINSHWVLSLATADKTFILPVLAGLATFAQLRMSQARKSPTAGKPDMMTNQMQIMSFAMPFVTFFFALTFPAGLALYWTASSLFSMVQQYFVTGWGSLFTMPKLGSLGGSLGAGAGASRADSRSNDYAGNSRKETALANKVVDSNAEVLAEREARPNYAGTNNSPTRRRRPNSSSARRRGTTPRRNPSHS